MLTNEVFTVNEQNFSAVALNVFRYQYQHNSVYQQYCTSLQIAPANVQDITKIPYLPISFFKSHTITTTSFTPELVFESSGTTQTVNSKHYVKNADLYRQSFSKAFRLFYGEPADWCILALLPSYLERGNSSLVMMADQLIKDSGNSSSGFYLDDFERLASTIKQLEKEGKKTLLIGVTFALLDFAAQFPMQLQHATIMETGGMKGRRKEITRPEVHSTLQQAFGLKSIHSEYGMTELLSQAYSFGNGIFNCPPWMKILLREEDDPFAIHTPSPSGVVSGAINIIDLANIYSCSFIAAEDAGRLHADGSFEVLGRLDNTDIRGCSLLAL